MSQELQRRRRAIITGLTPYMSEPLLLEAISHWQQHYSQRPRFTLQGFVSDLCKLFDLSERRHQIHMSLVQAMTLSDSELAEDPLASTLAPQDAHPCTQAFEALMRQLWKLVGVTTANQLRLDLCGQLRRRHVDAETRLTLEYWLQSPERPLAPLPLASLRDQLNCCYVLLCERLGPVEADRCLRDAHHQVSTDEAVRQVLHKLM